MIHLKCNQCDFASSYINALMIHNKEKDEE